MTFIPTTRLKGNYGAAVVTARLSEHALVRPVSADTDVGVDLYCESVAEDRPFLHFWLQVKSGDQCLPEKTGRRASCRFAFEKLEYWRRQPVPVFAALVPCEWPPRREPDVYIVDITAKLLFDRLPGDQESITIASDHY